MTLENSSPAQLEEGQAAPDFSLAVSGGGLVNLHDLRGKLVVLYFYPKDDTPGCTTEACNFRDNMGTIQQTGALVYGISPDTVAKHEKFITKHGLNFPLLADEGSAVATAYGVWVEKAMYGRKYMGVARSTFLIDEQGHIAKIWHKVKPAGHATEVLNFIKARQT
jgi:peroxiredoxin Q/BCP